MVTISDKNHTLRECSLITIRQMTQADCTLISDGFTKQGWPKPVEQYRGYLAEQETGERIVLTAFLNDCFCGYLTIRWRSYYPPFLQEGIPEIMDFNILKKYQKRGIGSRLMDQAETLIAARSSKAGIGVGLTDDYGTAQALYVKRGYVPDKRGISKNEVFLKRGDNVLVDDDLNLYLVKELDT